MSNMATIATAHALSIEMRQSRAKIRRDLQAGAITLAELLSDPPAEIHNLTVLDVLRLLRRNRSENRWEHEIGRHALTDQVNILVRVGVASRRTLDWATEHGEWHVVYWRNRVPS